MATIMTKFKKCPRCGRRHEPFEKKTEIIGYCGDTPIIKAYPEQDTGFLTFWCDYCKKEHTHGRGDGHRTAHCGEHYTRTRQVTTAEGSPYYKCGYFLNDVLVLGKRLPPGP